jgi:hypothetical protein
LTRVKTSQGQLTGEKIARGEMTTKVSCPGPNVQGLNMREQNVLGALHPKARCPGAS